MSWETAHQQLADLDYGCRVQAANLHTLTDEQRWLARHALNVAARG